MNPPRPRLTPEFVGPADARGVREDVSGWELRALVVRTLDEVLHMHTAIGGIMRELGRVQRKQSQDGEEITLVRNLRKDLKKARTWGRGTLTAILVLVVAAYVCMKLGLKLP